MILNPKEEGRFYNFFCFVEQHTKNEYVLVFTGGKRIECKFATACESDNCLELDDPKYEEFLLLVFRNNATCDLFEVTYHNMPVEVWCDGIKIDFGD